MHTMFAFACVLAAHHLCQLTALPAALRTRSCVIWQRGVGGCMQVRSAYLHFLGYGEAFYQVLAAKLQARARALTPAAAHAAEQRHDHNAYVYCFTAPGELAACGVRQCNSRWQVRAMQSRACDL